MTDFSQLSINSAGDLFDAMKNETVSTASDWFNQNHQAVAGYLQQLADAAMRTTQMLAQGTIPPEQAEMMFADQKAAMIQTFEFETFMASALAQKLLDGIFSIIGWTVFRHTGINLFPALVQPGDA
jgi:hypothetical protein